MISVPVFASMAGRLLALLPAICLLAALSNPAHADAPLPSLEPLVQGGNDARLDVIRQLGQSSAPTAGDILQALGDGRLMSTGDGTLLIRKDGGAIDPLTGAALTLPDGARAISVNNRLRRAIQSALAAAQLHAPDASTRLSAAQRLAQAPDAGLADALRQSSRDEADPAVRRAMLIALARIDLDSADADARRQAIATLGDSGNGAFLPLLRPLTEASDVDDATRQTARQAVTALERHASLVQWLGNLFYGISLGSVLLLASLGLAITFGLMGVINMAHGELLMVGAYVTFMTQVIFRTWLPPAWLDWYVVAALPAAFVITACVGMLMERTVIRWLYGRPLETLLATWGISLILMQGARSLFGAQNVEVSNPSWMSGGVTVLGDLVLSYNRIAIIVLAACVIVFVWLILNHTRLGLFVRAITQHRRMADCVGVPTGRIDMLAFGMGSGIAGIGGVALSQLGNVGPDLGRAYIVDSFMVVVMGGVGQLAGTVIAALGLGGLSKLLEPYAGAVLAKIAILVLIVLFIQKRPQGLFAPRGRSIE